MAILYFLISVFGATMLLLYAVRMVQTGIERAFGSSFKRRVTGNRNALRAATTGATMAIVLQSSAAVALLSAGFANAGLIAFPMGLSVILGADLGSAIAVQILSLRIDWLVPLLIGAGGWIFLNAESRKIRQAGRIAMGIALILVALRFLRETIEPIRESAFLPALVGYLEGDAITAFIAGAALALLMHSSVATVLMSVVLVSVGAVPLPVGVTLVLGANLGGALVPVWLTRNMQPPARRLTLANLFLRGVTAVLAMAVVQIVDIDALFAATAPGQALVLAHLAFNALLLVFLPFTRFLQAPMTALVRASAPKGADAPAPEMRSALDPSALVSPRLSLACLRREVLRMSHILEYVMRPAAERFFDGDPIDTERIERDRAALSAALQGVRAYVAQMPTGEMAKNQVRIVRDLMDYAISLESAGDVVVRRMVPVALALRRDGVRFSGAGWQELHDLFERVSANMTLAFSLLVSVDLEAARQVFSEKDDFNRAEKRSRKRHFTRLRDGDAASLASSDLHIETLLSLREFNGLIVSLAYPILIREGQLLETRLIYKSGVE